MSALISDLLVEELQIWCWWQISIPLSLTGTCSVLPLLSGISSPSSTSSLLGHCLLPSCDPALPSSLSLQFSPTPPRTLCFLVWDSYWAQQSAGSTEKTPLHLSLNTSFWLLLTTETCLLPGYCPWNFLHQRLSFSHSQWLMGWGVWRECAPSFPSKLCLLVILWPSPPFYCYLKNSYWLTTASLWRLFLLEILSSLFKPWPIVPLS